MCVCVYILLIIDAWLSLTIALLCICIYAMRLYCMLHLPIRNVWDLATPIYTCMYVSLICSCCRLCCHESLLLSYPCPPVYIEHYLGVYTVLHIYCMSVHIYACMHVEERTDCHAPVCMHVYVFVWVYVHMYSFDVYIYIPKLGPPSLDRKFCTRMCVHVRM